MALKDSAAAKAAFIVVAVGFWGWVLWPAGEASTAVDRRAALITVCRDAVRAQLPAGADADFPTLGVEPQRLGSAYALDSYVDVGEARRYFRCEAAYTGAGPTSDRDGWSITGLTLTR